MEWCGNCVFAQLSVRRSVTPNPNPRVFTGPPDKKASLAGAWVGNAGEGGDAGGGEDNGTTAEPVEARVPPAVPFLRLDVPNKAERL